MYVKDDIVYADNSNNESIKVVEIKIITDLCMLVTFNNGEKRIFDATKILKYPIYEPLKNYEIFKNAYVEHGVIIWENGKIDISPEMVYNNSYVYEQGNII